jgi:hypothetical protein
MKPATPKHPKHDAACPSCGEPFRAARFAGHKLGDYGCARCGQKFSVIGETYYIAGMKVPAWMGEPLQAGSQ